MADEKLVLVERFEDLRVGIRVVVKGCEWCEGADHGGMLVGRTQAWIRREDEIDDAPSAVFDVAPAPDCVSGGDAFAIDEETVAARAVFRYATDLDMERELANETNPYKEPAKVSERPRAGYWLSQ